MSAMKTKSKVEGPFITCLQIRMCLAHLYYHPTMFCCEWHVVMRSCVYASREKWLIASVICQSDS